MEPNLEGKQSLTFIVLKIVLNSRSLKIENRVYFTDRLKRASDEQRNAIEYCPLLYAIVLTVTRRRFCFGHSRDKTARRHVNSDPPSQLEKEKEKKKEKKVVVRLYYYSD